MGQEYAVVAESCTTTVANNLASGASLSIASGTFSHAKGNATIASGNLVLSAGNASMTTGNLTLTAGNLTLTAGNASLTSGNLTVASGTFALTGGTIPATSTPTATISVATANNTSIPIAGAIVRGSASAVTTAGSCTFAAGAVDGQQFTFINEGAASIIVTGNVRGTTTVSVSQAASFIWITAYTQWVRVVGA